MIKYLNSTGGIATIENDTIVYFEKYTDTLFSISKDNILKKSKGSYYLNFKISDIYWRVKKLNLKKDTLLIGEITTGDTLLRFDYARKIEEVSARTDSGAITKPREYILTPSKREFKKLVRSDAFETTEKYIKIK